MWRGSYEALNTSPSLLQHLCSPASIVIGEKKSRLHLGVTEALQTISS
jgi:hypothetical protein